MPHAPLRDVHPRALERLAVLVEEPLEPAGDSSDRIAGALQCAPIACGGPALRACAAGGVDSLELELASRVQRIEHIDDSIEAAVPCRQPAAGIRGGVGNEVGGRYVRAVA